MLRCMENEADCRHMADVRLVLVGVAHAEVGMTTSISKTMWLPPLNLMVLL